MVHSKALRRTALVGFQSRSRRRIRLGLLTTKNSVRPFPNPWAQPWLSPPNLNYPGIHKCATSPSARLRPTPSQSMRAPPSCYERMRNSINKKCCCIVYVAGGNHEGQDLLSSNNYVCTTLSTTLSGHTLDPLKGRSLCLLWTRSTRGAESSSSFGV